MKNIKALIITGILICTTSLLQAQDVKAEPGKQIEVKAPVADNKPSPFPVVKPQSGVTENAPVATKAPDEAAKQDEIKRPSAEVKATVLTIDPNASTKNLTQENINTMNGRGPKPKQTVPDQAAKPGGQ